MKEAVLASLSRAMKEQNDPVFGAAKTLLKSTSKKDLQPAYWKFKNSPKSIHSVLLRPYSKATGNAIFSARLSRKAVHDYQNDPENFKKKYRLIARMSGADKCIAKSLNFYLGLMLEGRFPKRPEVKPYLSEYCHAYRKTTGVYEALDNLENWAYDEGFEWVARTDVKSYFDVIDRDILKGQLDLLFNHFNVDGEHCIDWLLHLAGASKEMNWKIRSGPQGDRRNKMGFAPGISISNTYGIPQGNPISAPLSNLYLSDVDHEMVNMGEASGYRYLRYADDIAICAKTEEAAQAALDNIRSMLGDLNLELGESKTFVEHIRSGKINFLGFKYLNDARGKEIAFEKLQKFKGKIKHVTSDRHIKSLGNLNNHDLIQRVVMGINVMIKAKRGSEANGGSRKISLHSFPVHYSHNTEPAIFNQMASLDAFIRWRVARCLAPAIIPNDQCHKEFFGKILPKRNREVMKAGGLTVNLIPMTGIFRNVPAYRNAGSYGLDN